MAEYKLSAIFGHVHLEKKPARCNTIEPSPSACTLFINIFIYITILWYLYLLYLFFNMVMRGDYPQIL